MNFKNVGMEEEDRIPQQVGGTGHLPPITRQSSIYSLTLDEFQNTLVGAGKDFGSMNMEELLKSICSAEESQLMSSSSGAAALRGFPDPTRSGLQRQGSLMTLPRTISLKTVEEVWRDVSRDSSYAGDGSHEPTVVNLQPQHRQPTMGEITIQEFLVRAGVVREEPVASETAIVTGAIATNNNSSNSMDNHIFFGGFTGTVPDGSTGIPLSFPSSRRGGEGATVSQAIQSNPGTEITGDMVRSRYGRPFHLGNSNSLGNQQGVMQGGGMVVNQQGVVQGGGMVVNQQGAVQGGRMVVMGESKLSNEIRSGGIDGDRHSLSPVPYMFEGGQGKRGGVLDKAVERRQKRMIKNRESAARSRARKQAYTIELEAEVAKLKEQNKELQEKQEILESQKKQVLEMIFQRSETKKPCLRRTQTGPC